MAESTEIAWCDSTFNPWEGCQKVGPGCDHCYAEARNARFGGGTAPNWGPGAPRRRTSPANWRKPIAWDAAHAEFFATHGRRQRIFCASLADVFDNAVVPAWRADLLDLIARTPHLDWLLLTKRIGNVLPMLRELTPTGDRQDDLSRALDKPEHWGHCVAADWVNGISPKNVWLGATIVNQEEANRDIPKLLVVPAAKRFLSMEPLLGQVDLTRVYGIPHCAPFNALRPVGCAQHADGFCLGDCKWRFRGIDWVIVGGESGAGARPMHPDWARSLRDLCAAAGVAFLFKQWGEYGFRADLREDVMRESDGPEAPLIDMPAWMQRVGKRAAGRELDGVTHDGFPGEQHV